MKNLKIFLLFILVFLCVAGCVKKEKEEKKDIALLEDEVILENIKYKLDQDENEYGIKYKIASNFRKTTLSNAINYFSEDINENPYFVIRIFYYKNKSIDYAIMMQQNLMIKKKILK